MFVSFLSFQLHLPEGGLHADINGDGVLDHVQVISLILYVFLISLFAFWIFCTPDNCIILCDNFYFLILSIIQMNWRNNCFKKGMNVQTRLDSWAICYLMIIISQIVSILSSIYLLTVTFLWHPIYSSDALAQNFKLWYLFWDLHYPSYFELWY